MEIPNILDEEVPLGATDKDNKFVRKYGVIPDFHFIPKDHV